jgi:peptide/nickel transport system permease protein
LIPVILVISFIVFFLMSLSGDPVYSVAGDNMTEEQIKILRQQMGMNDPLFVRYLRYMAGVLRGDLGKSIYGGKDVWHEYINRLPYTIYLAVAAMGVALVIALPIGIIAAVKQNTWVDAISSIFAIAGLSIPGFWLGLMLIWLFAIKLGWLPVTGATAGIKSIIMPAITAGIGNAALIMRMTRSSMLDTLRQEYLRTARAKGVGERKVILKHALGNALIPIITIVGSQFSILFGGAVVTEMVFAWPGVGNLTVTAIRGNDYPMVTGCVIMTTVFTALVLLFVDIIYAYVDPRIKAQYVRT